MAASECNRSCSEAGFEWRQHVKDLRKQGTNWSFQCAYCPKKMTGGKTRLVEHFCPSTAKSKHLTACFNVPPDVIEAAKESHAAAATWAAEKAALQRAHAATRPATSASTGQPVTPAFKRLKKRGTPPQQMVIDASLASASLASAQAEVARFIYAQALPFSVVDQVWTVNAFDAVCNYGALTGRTTFNMPSKYSLRNKRLDDEVSRLEDELRMHTQAVQEYGVGLQSDGKDSVAKTHLVNIIASTPVGSRFVKTLDVSGQSRDAVHTARVLVVPAAALVEWHCERRGNPCAARISAAYRASCGGRTTGWRPYS